MILFIKKYQKIIISLIILLFLVSSTIFTGCIDSDNNVEKESVSEIFFGVTSDINGFYPWMIRDVHTCSVNQNFFNVLVRFDNKSRKLIPSLAVNWNNPDNVTWKFSLREDVRFHNGDNFTAWDVKFTINYLRNFSFYKECLESISDIEISNNYTIYLRTYEPNPLLLYDLISVNILSRKYINEIEGTNESWPIGTGPYKLVDYVPGDHIILEGFVDYWNGPPDVDRVNIIIFNDTNEKLNAFLKGDLDLVSIPFDYVDEISYTSGLSVKSIQTFFVGYLGFDFRVNDSYGFYGEKNPISDISVRRAIYHAINIKPLVETITNFSAVTIASQFVTPYIFGYNPNISRLSFDLVKARQLMMDSGYEDGFEIELDCSNSNSTIAFCNEIANQLSMINITIILNPLPLNEYLAKLYYKNTSFYFTSYTPLTADSMIEILLHTCDFNEEKGIWNYGNYSNKRIDELYDIISRTLEPEVRKKLIQEIFYIAMEDVVWIPLYSPKAFYGFSDNLNFNPRPSAYILFEEISFIK